MKKHFIKTLVVCTLLAVTASAFTGCKNSKEGNSSTTTNEKLSEETLKLYFFGDSNTFKNYQPVLDEFYNKTKDTLNTKLEFNIIAAADYGQQMKLKIAAQEDMDLVFDAPWRNLNTFATQGVYQELDKYFNSDKYPGLKKAFSKDYLEANKILGKQIAVPITNTFIDLEGFLYRKDLVKKYNLKDIQSYADLEAYLKAVKDNEKGMTPLGAKTPGLGRNWKDETRDRDGNVYLISGVPAGIEVAISKDGKTVLGVAAQAETESAYTSFPAPWNKPNIDLFVNAKKLSPYMNQDAMVAKEIAPLFNAGKVAAIEGTLNDYANTESALKKAVPGAELGFWVSKDDSRNMKAGAILTTYQAWNFLCVPTVSKKADRTMKFLDWVYASQENNDLFTLGIKGKNWEAVGDKQWKLPTGVDAANNYAFPGYELTWNPLYSRTSAALPSDMQKLAEYEFKADTFKKSLLSGFTFDQTNVKTEIAKLSGVGSKYDAALKSGQVASVSETMAQRLKEEQDAGLEKVKAEVKTQVQKFLDGKK